MNLPKGEDRLRVQRILSPGRLEFYGDALAGPALAAIVENPELIRLIPADRLYPEQSTSGELQQRVGAHFDNLVD